MDDAGVYKISNELALVQTLDFFTPMVDDPYVFGQVAAVNAINDIYAMGAKPLTAMNIVCFPQHLDMGILGEILKGGISKIKEAGATLLGGHTIEDDEPKYGLSVTGLINPAAILTNAGAEHGLVLVLTKPLGTGIISTAIKGKIASEEQIADCIKAMTALNSIPGQVMLEAGVKACTDITGFGLLGHLLEMAQASGVSLKVDLSAVPLLSGVLDLANMGIVPAGARRNLNYVKEQTDWLGEVSDAYQDILADPQTAGGMLMAVEQDKVDELVRNLQRLQIKAIIIGECLTKSEKSIIVEGF